MNKSSDTITINAVVEMPAAALQDIVKTAKQLTGRDEKGAYRVDTADVVGGMISMFLVEKDFETYVKDVKNYNL
ncbi:MAG: hypothetical protein B6I22_00255 [Desulfobacteraceae bacterium 4572_123]|nr:MAG: hypothetical protein B6I22_00255 [Desulfobacteraceae bacterium 4572_123]